MEGNRVALAILEQVKKAVVGKDEVLAKVLLAILARGHILLEDIPGVGKTTMALAFSKALALQYNRVQFTPDVMPSDITGFSLFNKLSGKMEYQPGAVLCNLFLADELNRATSRTQSALLEAMEERQISIDGERFPLPAPFIVLATQNPVESESTFRLPAAQMDRFLIRVSMGYPQPAEERQMLRQLGDGIPFDLVHPVTNAQELIQAQEEIRRIHVSDQVADYIVALADATRSHPQLKMGASPRATRGLYRAVKVWAAMEGRDFVTPDDVKALTHPVLEHRMVLESGARFSGVTAKTLLDEVLDRTQASPAPETVVHER